MAAGKRRLQRRRVGPPERASDSSRSGSLGTPIHRRLLGWVVLQMEDKWATLFTHKGEWVDQRGTKVGRQPDFACRTDRGRALWLDSRNLPSSVHQKVAEEFGVRLASYSPRSA